MTLILSWQMMTNRPVSTSDSPAWPDMAVKMVWNMTVGLAASLADAAPPIR